MAHAGDRGLVLRLCRWPGSTPRVGRAAERNHIGECAEAQEVGVVERTDSGLAESAVDAHRHPAHADRFAEPCGEAAAGDQALDRSRLAFGQPGQHREVVRRIERDQVRGVSLDQRGDDALRRHFPDARDRCDPRCQVGGEGLVGGLDRQQARRDIHERRAWNDDEIGAHARKAGRHAVAQCPAGDKAGESDADAEHHGCAEKDRSQPPAADVLRGQPDQQPKVMPAMGHLAHNVPVCMKTLAATLIGTSNAPHRRIYDTSVGFGFEVPERTRGTVTGTSNPPR